jgi:formate dehydrogenase maturation protein FdhE
VDIYSGPKATERDETKMHQCPNCGEYAIEDWEIDPEIDIALCNECQTFIKIMWHNTAELGLLN